MDDDRFDALSRLVARGASRRQLLQRLGGGLAAAGFAVAGHASAAAFICRQPGVLCAKDAQCCSGLCEPTTHRCLNGVQGTCAAGADLCAGTGDYGCNNNSSCFCATTTEDNTACVLDAGSAYCGQCTSSADCGAGSVCVKDTGGGCSCETGIGFCEPVCGA